MAHAHIITNTTFIHTYTVNRHTHAHVKTTDRHIHSKDNRQTHSLFNRVYVCVSKVTTGKGERMVLVV